MFRHRPWYLGNNLVMPADRSPMAIGSVWIHWLFKNWYAHRVHVLGADFPGIWREKIAVIFFGAVQHVHQMFVKTNCFDTMFGFDAKEVPHDEVQELMDHVGALGVLPQFSFPLFHSVAEYGTSVASVDDQGPKVVVVELSLFIQDERSLTTSVCELVDCAPSHKEPADELQVDAAQTPKVVGAGHWLLYMALGRFVCWRAIDAVGRRLGSRVPPVEPPEAEVSNLQHASAVSVLRRSIEPENVFGLDISVSAVSFFALPDAQCCVFLRLAEAILHG